LSVETLFFAEKKVQSNKILTKNTFGQMIFRPKELFRSNDHLSNKNRSIDFSVKLPYGQMTFQSNDSLFEFNFRSNDHFPFFSVKLSFGKKSSGKLPLTVNFSVGFQKIL
jgi:hypothetical protein